MRRAGAIVVAAALAAAALWFLRWTTPAYIELTGAMPAYGKGEERVEGRLIAVKVEKIRLANQIKIERFGKRITLDSGGVFAVVSIEASAVSETAAIARATWVGRTGRRYASTQRLSGIGDSVVSTPIQPGLPRKGTLFFELPEDEIDGGELRLAQTFDPRLDSEIRIALETRYVAPPTPLEISRGG